MEALSIPRSSYYRLKDKEDNELLLKRYGYLKKKIETIIKDSSGYGYRRITDALKEKYGIVINQKVVKKLLKIWSLQLKRKIRKYKPSHLEKMIVELGANFNLYKKVTEPSIFQVLFTDFSEIKCLFGKIQLILYLDMKSKRVCGWNVSRNKDRTNALKAYRKATRYLKRMNVSMEGIIVHQDRDRVFTSYEYVGELLDDGVRISYAKNGFKDNPYMESFFGRFKEEFLDLISQAKDLKEAEKIIHNCMVKWNKSRIHSALEGRSPDEFIRDFQF